MVEHEDYIKNGLRSSEVSDLIGRGLVNGNHNAKTKTVGKIIMENTCTLFNLINVILAVCVAMTGSYKNMLFMGVIACNVIIGIIQELRAKHIIDKLTVLSAPRAKVRRDGRDMEIKMQDIVLGDLCMLARGDQVCADSVVIDGSCEVDESLLTGERDAVFKSKGDGLLSGSFLVSGEVCARVCHVGADNYAYKLVHEAKYIKKPNSEMMQSINKIIKIVSICIIPLAAILFYKQWIMVGQSLDEAVISTVAAIIAMIPEGLVLLTSVVLAVSVIRLSKEKTLVQELYCIETLARVNVLCLDKTGTLTEGEMQFKELVKLEEDCDCEQILCEMLGVLSDHNQTFDALKGAFKGECRWKTVNVIPFSSEKKFSRVDFENNNSYMLGACEFILTEGFEDTRKLASKYSSEGYRVLLLAQVMAGGGRKPLCFLLIEDILRGEAADTLAFFASQGVELKIISGDHPATVAAVARKAGFKDISYVDASDLTNDKQIAEAATKYNVFGRVTPHQKLKLVKALKSKGYTVGMTGDGVNDVLALREADCSVAMQSGSDAARNVSKLVLLNSNFSSMPKVVAEGRRSINNLERSAALFLEKTVYASLLAVIFVFLKEPYPFKPIQMTLVNALTIGVPSFLLALEPNYSVVKGHFFKNVMRKALPGGFLVVANVVATIFSSKLTHATDDQVSTITVLLTAVVSFIILFRICCPWNTFRRVMFTLLLIAFAVAFLFFKDFFMLTSFSFPMAMIALGQGILSIIAVEPLSRLINKILK